MAATVLRSKRRIEPMSRGAGTVSADGTSTSPSPVVIEATISETHAQAAEITSHPVEDGLDVTDYVRPGPIGLEMSVAFSNQPMVFNEQHDGSDGLHYGDNVARVSAAWEAFLNLINGRPKRALLQVSTGLKLYDNMLIESIGTEQTVDNPDSIVIRVRLRQVQVVTTGTTTVRQIESGEQQDRGTGNVDAGDQNAVEALDCDTCPAICEHGVVENPAYEESVDGAPECFDGTRECEPKMIRDPTQIERERLNRDVTTSKTRGGAALRNRLCNNTKAAALLDAGTISEVRSAPIRAPQATPGP